MIVEEKENGKRAKGKFLSFSSFCVSNNREASDRKRVLHKQFYGKVILHNKLVKVLEANNFSSSPD